MPKFSSYKNSLQEYCQKSHLPVPTYRAVRESTGFVSTVNFSTNIVQGKIGTDNSKDADQRTAFEALKQLGYLPEDMQFEQTTGEECPSF